MPPHAALSGAQRVRGIERMSMAPHIRNCDPGSALVRTGTERTTRCSSPMATVQWPFMPDVDTGDETIKSTRWRGSKGQQTINLPTAFAPTRKPSSFILWSESIVPSSGTLGYIFDMRVRIPCNVREGASRTRPRKLRRYLHSSNIAPLFARFRAPSRPTRVGRRPRNRGLV